MELTYRLQELDVAVDYILKNTKSKTLLFYGEMGAGKTTLIKELVKALGVQDTASSPTFSLVNHYESEEGSVFHFDFYRIEDETEALDMGIEDYLESESWNLIEWPEKIENLLGENTQKLLLQVESEETRKLKFC
ncbi:tRNA (adenosine(37)-N6)-threonylcarbamoyltransferase complex ATPase subunit type 1 TsaE [Gramella sp. MT6]|uniref:tRNA (adenosine(37)-N6)-threonylcarbamoyltransferase complex ATPase subunit type 1 TsaE n=1 Tax=Gramella sp. MT6 TaxID=2705471 RepID=UPI001C5DF4AD|nr:tRNA (adenosine(37)-N6)-threonylcarbamoyltransferase complex ATPase subunit type 1 TsaE [Gramella sp. MT6]QYA26310.1 tRNA (adenosine(37)-N6)-threonylcarbamoyltransferase complex ATPase subunit type 1 TsaE [Gramella sp. MT6]